MSIRVLTYMFFCCKCFFCFFGCTFFYWIYISLEDTERHGGKGSTFLNWLFGVEIGIITRPGPEDQVNSDQLGPLVMNSVGMVSKLPLFSYGRDGHQAHSRGLHTHYKDSRIPY